MHPQHLADERLSSANSLLAAERLSSAGPPQPAVHSDSGLAARSPSLTRFALIPRSFFVIPTRIAIALASHTRMGVSGSFAHRSVCGPPTLGACALTLFFPPKTSER